MFKFLKNKIKDVVAKISKKVDEEGKEEVVEQPVEEVIEEKKPTAEELLEEVKKEPSEPEVEKPKEEKKVEEVKEEPAPVEVSETEVSEHDQKSPISDKPKPEQPKGLPIKRDQAIELLKSMPQEKSDMNHYLETEAIMKSLARHFNEDEEYWAMIGLLHDVDWALTKNDWTGHTVKAEELLKEKGFDDEFIQIVQSHGYGYDEIPIFKDKKRTKKIEYCLIASETLTGIIYAYALMRGRKIYDMEVKGLKKKFKDKTFAANCNRELVREIEKTGLDLSEFFKIAIDAVKEIAEEVGLIGKPVEEKPVEPEVKTGPVVEKEPEKPVEPEVEEKASEPVPIEEPKKGFFRKIKQAIVTKKIDNKQFENIFWDLELVLLENNVAVEVIEKIKHDLKQELVDQNIPRAKTSDIIIQSLSKTIKSLFEIPAINILEKSNQKKPLVMCFVGINGSGKTTTIAKVAKYFQNNNKSVVLAASDTFRAAAIDQLQQHADKLDVKLIKHDYGSDAAAVAFDAIKHAESKNIDVVLIDTAGRIHSNTNLMDEMKKIIRVANPDLKIFVGESITGNDCTEQAKKFNETIGIDGIILSKADIDEKGGAAISVSYVTKKPILFIGTGQEYQDLTKFDKDFLIKSLGL